MKKITYLIVATIIICFTGCQKCSIPAGTIVTNGNWFGTDISFQFVPTNNADIDHIYWDFGNGNHELSYYRDGQPTSVVNNRYSSNGTYEVSAIVYNSCGDKAVFKRILVITEAPGGGGGSSTPQSVRINKFTLRAYPLKDGDTDWDITDAGPDIYFKIYKGETLLYTSDVKNNVSESSLPLTWNISNVILGAYSDFVIKFYDKDGVLDPDDYMGAINFDFSAIGFDHTVYDWYTNYSSWAGTWYYTWIY